MRNSILHKASTILIIGILAYWGGLDNFFYGDDFGFISEARAIRLFKIKELWPGLISIIQPFWFRVEFVFFFINNLLESLFGLNPFLYHLHNLLLHIASWGFLYGIILKISASPRVSFLSSLFFLLNPLSAETVYWYTGSHTLYAAFFIILTLWCYCYSHRRLSVLFLSMAMCTKPEAAVLLLYVFLIDMCLYDRSDWRGRWKRLGPLVLAGLAVFILYALYYRNAASWPIPEHRFQFHISPNSGMQLFDNLSYLLLPVKKIYYLAIPSLFSLAFLNLSLKEKRMIVLGLGFVLLSVLPYQLFIIDPQGFYFWRYETVRYFYVPAIGQAFLSAAVLGVLLERSGRARRALLYGCLGFLFISNIAALVRLDGYFEQRERPYKTLVEGVRPYFKKGSGKFWLLFNYPSFADPTLTSFYTSDLPLISELFFEGRLISVAELKSTPDSAWIKEKYPALPPQEEAELLDFDGERIKMVPEKDRDSYYQYFLSQAGYLYPAQ